MIIDILNKVLILLFVLSCLNVVRHTYYLIQAYVKSKEEQPQKYILSKTSLLIVGLSLAYIIMSIINGITL